MSLRWIGGAAAVAQVDSWSFSGTWLVGETVTITIGTKTWTFTTASATINTFLDTMVTDYNALSSTSYPEYAEMTASRPSSGVFRLTADTAGKSFTVSLSTNSASGTIGSVTHTTANAGPYDFSTAANWTGGVAPADNDVLDLGDGGEIRYGLDQSANTYTGRCGTTKVGLPHINASGYPEYRQQYLKVDGGTWTVGTGNPSSGQSGGPSRFKIENCTTLIVHDYDTAQRDYQNLEPILAVGTITTVTLTKAEIGFAVLGGETCAITTLNQGFGDVVARAGTGASFTTINKEGGRLVVEAPGSITLNNIGGETILNGSGAPSQITITGGTVVYNTSGTLGGNTVVSNGTLNFNQDPRSKAVTNPIDVFGSGRVLDDFKVVSSLVIDFNQASVPGFGSNIRLTRGSVA